MAKTTTYTMRIDPQVKADAESLFASLGLSMADAINVFLLRALLEQGFPFEVKKIHQAEPEKN